jgi:hypothetical protein
MLDRRMLRKVERMHLDAGRSGARYRRWEPEHADRVAERRDVPQQRERHPLDLPALLARHESQWYTPTIMPSALKPPLPTCPALNLRLDFRQREGTLDLLGVFNALSVAVFPLRLHLCVHYVLLDGQGHYEMELGAAADVAERAQRDATSIQHDHSVVGVMGVA